MNHGLLRHIKSSLRSTRLSAVACSVAWLMFSASPARADAEQARLAIAAAAPRLTLSFAITPPVSGETVDLDVRNERRDRLCLDLDCPISTAVLERKEPVLTRGQASARYIRSLGSGPATVLSWFCPPIVPNSGITFRFGLVFAVGGPAVGIRARW